MFGAEFACWQYQEEVTMYHLIEFNTAFTADLEISPKQRMERLRVRKGTHARVGLRPYVLETAAGLVEVADLYFDDGTVTRQVPFQWFRFVE
jgi:hypothetical protein